MKKVLTDFYVTCGDSSNVTHKDVNQAWTKVAQNVGGCVYNRLCDAKNFLVVATLCDGVIPVDAVDATFAPSFE